MADVIGASLATKVEDWIVARIRSIEVNGNTVFDAEDVQPWGGTNAPSISEFATELMQGRRDTSVRVFFRRDEVVPLEAGAVEILPTYTVLVGQRNARSRGEARRGESTTPGTNDLRDLLQAALHNVRPSLSAHGKHTTRSRWAGSSVELAQDNLYVQMSRIIVPEVPANS